MTTKVEKSRPRKRERPCIPLMVRPNDYQLGDELAKRECQRCKQPIGYYRQFWFVSPLSRQLVHNVCRHKPH